MAGGAFFIMAIMLFVLLVSAAGAAFVSIVAVVLASNSRTRATGFWVFLIATVGVVATDIFVAVLRLNPSWLDRLPRATQIFLAPFDWSFISPAPVFAFLSSSLFGFACAGGAAALVAVVIR